MKLTRKLNRNEIKVAAFIVLPIIGILLFIVLKLGYSIAGSTFDVYLKVDNINSIKKGTQVKIKGYSIGRIIEIKPVYKPSLYFLAKMRLKKEIEIYENCSAMIQNQNIIGEPEIEIRNPAENGPLISEGSVIEGVEYVNLEALLKNVHDLLINLSETVDVLKNMSLESKNNIRSLVANLSASVATINQMLNDSQKDVGVILESFKKTAVTMDEISKELKKHPVSFLFKGKDEKEEDKK